MSDRKLTPEQAELVSSYIPLAKSIANKHSLWETANGLSRDDREGEAMLGLVEAATTWDSSKAAFSTYATKVIKNKIIKASRQYNNPYGMPWEAHTILRDMNRAVANGIPNTIGDISDYLNINPRKIEELWVYHIGATLQGVEPEVASSKSAEDDVIEGLYEIHRNGLIDRVVSSLPSKHQAVIRCRFGFETGEPMLAKEAMEYLGLSKSEYHTIEGAAMRALKNILRKFL